PAPRARPRNTRAGRARTRRATSAARPDVPCVASRSLRRPRDDDDLLGLGRAEQEPLARERLDARVRRPRALLDLQAAPVDLQPIVLAVQLLELDEEAACIMLGADQQKAGADHGHGERRREHELSPFGAAHAASWTGSFSATRSRALRARGFRAISSGVGRMSLPMR